MADDNGTQDEEWMEAVCQGDRRAYRALVDRHWQAISHYAFRLLGDVSEAEDICQETFLRLWKQAEKWQPGKARLSTWLHRISHNLCIDHLRKHSRLQAEADPGQFAEAETTERRDHEGDDREEMAGQLQQALAALPESQRSALMLCSHSGFSNQEAAAIMGISVKALESCLARARRNLRSSLFTDDKDA
jgi:RNA polymerase sigma-70 factor (ECF subfamily)